MANQTLPCSICGQRPGNNGFDVAQVVPPDSVPMTYLCDECLAGLEAQRRAKEEPYRRRPEG